MDRKIISFIAIAVVVFFFCNQSYSDYVTGAPFINGSITDDTSSAPDAFGYTWKDSQEPGVTYNFLDTTYGAGTWTFVTGLGDDNYVGPFNLGFSFRYYYYNVNKIWIGSNGYIMFGGGNSNLASPFPLIPTAGLPNDIVMGFASDLNFEGTGNTGKCYYYSNNTDTLIVTWLEVPFWATGTPPYTGSNTFQIILAKTDSSIVFQYETQTGLTSNNSISCGIENITGQVGLQYLYGIYPTPGRSVKFFYPDTVTYQVTDVAVNWIENEATGAIFKIVNDQTQLTANFINTGNQNVPTFKAVANIKSGATTILVDSINVPALVPGQDTTLTFDSIFVPTSTGTFGLEVITLLNDGNPLNNSKTLEIGVIRRDTLFNELRYDNGFSGSNISWTGGTGAVAQYFIPPAYPVSVDSIKFYITTTPPGIGFFARILDDDGPNGLPGTQLFSQTITSPTLNSFNSVPVTGVTITEGGFYATWVMNGAALTLGEDISQPISNRSFEGFGTIFSNYRNGATQDPMIRATIRLPASVGITQLSNKVPNTYSLAQNYPNPFNPVTKISFSVPKSSLVKLVVYDILGREIEKLVNQNLTAGSYEVEFGGLNLNSGVYFYRLESEGYTETRKMLLIK